MAAAKVSSTASISRTIYLGWKDAKLAGGNSYCRKLFQHFLVESWRSINPFYHVAVEFSLPLVVAIGLNFSSERCAAQEQANVEE